MTLTIESTDKIIGLTKNGPHEGTDVTVPARLWTGVTEQGVPVYVFVTRIAVRQDHDTAQFERELTEVPHLRAGLNDLFPHGVPARLVL
jgi:hypothetical protein